MSKVISCIGDSLTEGDYGVFGKAGIANVQKENYPYFLAKLTGSEVRNFGYCGYRSLNIIDKFSDGSINVAGSDIILIMLGTNGGQTPEGTSENDVAYRKIITLCHQQAPNARVILMTPPHCTINPKWSNCGYRPNVDSASLFVRKVARELNLGLIDLNSNGAFNDDNEEIMHPNDGLHFGKVGYETLANIVFEEIKNHLE